MMVPVMQVPATTPLTNENVPSVDEWSTNIVNKSSQISAGGSGLRAGYPVARSSRIGSIVGAILALAMMVALAASGRNKVRGISINSSIASIDPVRVSEIEGDSV